jgi:uncharacterized protein YjlB
MVVLETIKRIAEKATGWKRPDKPQGLVNERAAQTFRFKDDGLIPNHPRWPLILYKGVVRLTPGLDPAAVFEDLFDSHGWGSSWRDGIYGLRPLSFAHPRSPRYRAGQRAGAIRRGKRAHPQSQGGRCRYPSGRHRASTHKGERRFLVVGAYPASGAYDECKLEEDRKTAIPSIDRVARPRQDLVYGKDGPLTQVWPPRKKRRS